MATYKITLRKKGIKASEIERSLAMLGATVTLFKMPDNPSRAERLAQAESLIEEGRSIIEELKDEIDNWKDNLPENLQGSDKYEQLEGCSYSLEEIVGNIEQCDFSSVEFPGMY